ARHIGEPCDDSGMFERVDRAAERGRVVLRHRLGLRVQQLYRLRKHKPYIDTCVTTRNGGKGAAARSGKAGQVRRPASKYRRRARGNIVANEFVSAVWARPAVSYALFAEPRCV